MEIFLRFSMFCKKLELAMYMCSYSFVTFYLYLILIYIMYVSFSVSLSHQGPARKPKLIEEGATIFTKLNDLNAEKEPSPAVT